MFLTKYRRLERIGTTLLVLPLLLAMACDGSPSAGRSTTGGASAAASERRWYEAIDNTPQDPERRSAGEPDYGLCGLYLVDRPRFDVLVKPYVTSADRVEYITGCIGDFVPASRLVADGDFNILNGGWPNAFRQAPDRPVEGRR